ncbi:MAG: DUF3501 family protein [Parvibaculales bacterium]
MPATERKVTPADIMPMDKYTQIRKTLRQEVLAIKRPRRIDIGPIATIYFENYDTMLAQIQEMLYIEQGGDEQLEDELNAYNPLIPQGQELTATLMFEIEDETRRGDILRTLTDIELKVYVEVNGEKFFAKPEQEVERTASDGKTSSVHFLHFPFSETGITAIKQDDAKVVVGIEHENYGHMAMLTADSRQSLGADFA